MSPAGCPHGLTGEEGVGGHNARQVGLKRNGAVQVQQPAGGIRWLGGCEQWARCCSGRHSGSSWSMLRCGQQSRPAGPHAMQRLTTGRRTRSWLPKEEEEEK